MRVETRPRGWEGRTVAVDEFTSEAITLGVRVRVVSRYSRDQLHPEQNRWFFIYTITISNEGDATVQLLTRHWIIENADGRGR